MIGHMQVTLGTNYFGELPVPPCPVCSGCSHYDYEPGFLLFIASSCCSSYP